jgi:DNA polymerase/3'-5' exonuclease PolX
MNVGLINEFERLIAFINEESDKAQNEKDLKKVTSNQFRLKQLKNVLGLLKKYPTKITLENYKELINVQGIGKSSVDRIKEILEKGSLSELGKFVDQNKEKKKILDDLESVVGIGHSHALEFYNQGVKSVADLKKKIKSGDVEVNEKIQLGLKYYGKFQGNIPRKEITSVYKIIVDIIKQLNKKVPEEKQFIFEICGSYRREKPTSGDIDILISKKSDIDSKENYLENIVKFLKEPLKKNDDKPLLIDDLTDKNIETKYMGFCRYKDNPPRRIDIRFIPYESWWSALLYFTGSADLNKKMRQIAKTKNLKLSEYGLFKENSKPLKITSERDVFDILEMEYLHPRLR